MKFLKSFLKKCLVNLIRLYLHTKSNTVFNSQEVKKVIVYAYTGLGNFVLYMPTLRAIKNFLPQASFTLLHGNDTGCHEVVSGSNLFDEYIVVKRNAYWWTRIKWIYRIRRKRYNLIISEYKGNHLFMVFLTILSGVKYKLGHISSAGWENDWDCIYNIPVKMKKGQHERDRYLELAYALGISKQIDKNLCVHINSGDIEFAEKFIVSHNIHKGDKIVSVQLGTSPIARWKQWSLDKYRRLCDMIAELPNTKVILQGSPDEVKMIESMANEMINKPVVAAGKTSVKQAAALIKKSNLLICNDSGLMHIAVAMGTPVVAIYGPTDYTGTAPIGEKHTIIRKNLSCSPCFRLDGIKSVENCPYDYKCLKLTTVDEVYEVVKEKLRI